MGLFDAFKKKECCICGNEVGLLGNRKLADGNMCSKCTKRLSPWFEDRRESTVEQIKEQLAYRDENARLLESFNVSRTIGENYKMYIEEQGDVPVRFFVTSASDYKAANPDIISFKDVISCVTDIDVRDEEMKQKNEEGQMVSYDPPRFKHHHEFYIKMEIRNNPYFDNIKFNINRGVVTLESVGAPSGLAGLFGGQQTVLGRGISASTLTNANEQRRYNEFRMMCEKIEQAVEDGKRGSRSTGFPDSIDSLLNQIRNAPDIETATQISSVLVMMALASPNKEEINSQTAQAMSELRVRLDHEAANIPYTPSSTVNSTENKTPKFCPECGTRTEGGKFCQNCGYKLI